MRCTLALAILATSLWSCNSDKLNSTSSVALDSTEYSLKAIDDLHERLTFKDRDETLHDFVNAGPNKIDSTRRVVYLLPFGNMKPEVEKIVQQEVDYLKAFLQLEIKVLDRIPFDSIQKMSAIQTRTISSEDFEHYSKMKEGIPTLTEQINANSFMETMMANNKPKDAIAVLGITEHDIYNSGYNFIFGVSELNDGTGLVSTFRLIDYGPETKYNIRKVVSKQLVNMFSIRNVKDFKCVMNYHNSIDELSAGKFDLSPRALEKLKFAIGFDYSKRFDDLAKFWGAENNQEEVKYYQECSRRTNSRL